MGVPTSTRWDVFAKAAETSSGEGASKSTTGGSSEGSDSESTGTQSEKGQAAEKGHSEAGAKILGVNTESLALSIVAVVLSVLFAGAVLLQFGRWSRLVLLAVVGFGLVFTAGDAREVVHQLDDSNNGLATVAAILIALHLGIALLAALLLRPWRSTGAAVVHPT